MVLLERLLHSSHVTKDVLLLPAATDDLHGGGETRHLGRVVVFPRTASNAVITSQTLEGGFVGCSKGVADRVYVAYWDNTGGVVEQVPQEGVAARGDGIVHGVVRESWGSVDRTQDEIELLGLGVPPLVPGGAEGFALGGQGPQLRGGLGAEVADESGGGLVAADVAHVKVVEVAERAGEVGDAGELDGAWVGGFKALEVGVEVVAAI